MPSSQEMDGQGTFNSSLGSNNNRTLIVFTLQLIDWAWFYVCTNTI